MRRVTSILSASLKAAGAVRSELSRTNATSAKLRAVREPPPEKMTSSIAEARIFLYEFSPMTHLRASMRLDLPHPLGPTTPVNPGWIRSSVDSQKLLKPRRRRRSNFMEDKSVIKKVGMQENHYNMLWVAAANLNQIYLWKIISPPQTDHEAAENKGDGVTATKG